MSLATLLHISDLHFGDIDPNTGDAIEPTFVGLNEVFDGLLGHSYYSLKKGIQTLGGLAQERRTSSGRDR